MIKIVVDKTTEYVWIRKVVDTGVLNAKGNFFKENNIPTSQTVTYIKSENYIKDWEEKNEKQIQDKVIEI